MANWQLKIYIGDFVNNDELNPQNDADFIKIRNGVADRIEKYLPQIKRISKNIMTLEMALEDLRNTQDADEYDDAMQDIYDFADTYKIWIDSFSNTPLPTP